MRHEGGWFYVLAATYPEAVNLAHEMKARLVTLRFVKQRENLIGIDGNGRTLYVLPSAARRIDHNDCIELAKSRGFTIKNVTR